MGKSNTNNLPAPTNLTRNPYGKKNSFFFLIKRCNSKIGLHGSIGNCNNIGTMEADFVGKFPHLREKGGVLTQIGAHGE
jgi:hypothetical protein